MAAQLAVLGGLAVVSRLTLAGWVAGTVYAVGICTLLTMAMRRYGMRTLGPANVVTLARATLVGAVTALVATTIGGGTPIPVLVAVASVALALDAVDGLVARRTGTTSELGAWFDGEIDAFLILVLSVFVARHLGGWVLLIGAFRYAFLAAGRVLPWLRQALPTRYTRKAVAATQGIVLVVASAGVLPVPLTTVLVGTALALLCWSFGRDVRWLWRRRPEIADFTDVTSMNMDTDAELESFDMMSGQGAR
jgi:phosphatidylglycerophosphate synthase